MSNKTKIISNLDRIVVVDADALPIGITTLDASQLANITAANVIGDVSGANHANIADAANVAYSVDAANVSGEIANANYSAYSGTSLEIANGTSNVRVASTNGNVQIGVDGVDDIAVLSSVEVTISQPLILTAGVANSSPSSILNTKWPSGNVLSSLGSGFGYQFYFSDGASEDPSTGYTTSIGADWFQIYNPATFGFLEARHNYVALNDGTGNGVIPTDPTHLTTKQYVDSFVQVQIANGSSNVNIPVADSSIELWVGGMWVGNIAPDESNVTSNFSAGGNISGANLVTSGGVVAFDINVTDLYVNGGFANLGDVTAVHITGGNSGQVLSTDGSGILSWTSSVANANYAAYSGTADSANSVEGANVSGQVANALVAGTVTDAAQPNITSLGTLTDLAVGGDATITGNLTVSGNVTYANVNTVIVEDPVIQIGGGANGNPLTTNDGRDRGTYLHVFDTAANAEVDKFMGWDNSASEFAFGSNVTLANDVVTFNSLGNIRAGHFIGNGSILSSLNGANVSGQVSNALVASTVYTAAQPNITSVGTLTGLTVSGVSNLGPIGNITITGGSNNQVLATNGSGSLSWVTPFTQFKYVKEFHVDTYNGNDTTGDGSYEKPFKTIMKAHSVMDGSGQVLYIHAGLYSENVTWTRVNTDIVGVNDGGITYLQGAWTVSPASSSVRFQHVMWGTTASLTHNTAGSLYLTGCTMSPITFTKSGSGYVQIQDCDFGSVTSVSITGAGQFVINGGFISNITINNANAIVSTVGCLNVRTVTVTAGLYSSKGSVIYSTSNTANAITSSAGTTTYLFETSVYTPLAAPARVSIAGFNSINSSQYDLANSTITGTNLGTVTYSDAINVRGVSTLGAVGNVRITGGSSGQFLQTNGSGVLSFASAPVWVSTPATNTSAGVAGQAAYDSGGNLYICVAANTWSKITGTTSW